MASQKKKRRNRPTPETDKSIKVSGGISGSNNTLVTGDRNTIINTTPEPKPIKVPSYSDDDLGLIKWGRRIMRALFHTQNHGLGLFSLLIVLFGLGSGTVVVYPYAAPNNPFYTTSSPGFLIIEVAAFLVFGVAFYLGSVVAMAYHTQCPRCGWKFSKIIKDKVLTNTRTMADGTLVENYDVTYVCENPSCDFKEGPVQKVETFRPEPDPDEGNDE